MPVLPVPGVTDGPDWAVMLNAAVNEVEARAAMYTKATVGSWWSSPHLGIVNNKPLANLINFPLWVPPMGAAVQGFIDINSTTAGLTGDTVTVTLYGCTSEYLVDTATTIATVVFPIGTTVGRTEVALSAGFVIPQPYGMYAQITAYTGGSPARLTSGSPLGASPGHNWSFNASGGALGFTPVDLPVIFFKRTA